LYRKENKKASNVMEYQEMIVMAGDHACGGPVQQNN
jgi:hypothetical protein